MRNTFKVTLVSVLGISVLMSGCKPATSQESQQTEIQPENTGCLVCKDLEKLDALASKSNSDDEFIDGVKEYIGEVRTDKQYAGPTPIVFSVHGFCENEDVQQLFGLQDNYIAEFETIAENIQSCTEVCNIKLNEAEYCTVGNMLSYNKQDWSEMSAAFQSAAFLLQDADLNQRTTATEVNLVLEGILTAAQNSLTSSFAGLFGAPMSENPSVELELVIRELHELGIGLQALYWAGLSNGNGQKLGGNLIWLSKEIAAIETDTYTATTRAKLLEPNDRLDLAKRTITASALLSLVKQSLSESADMSLQPTGPNTQANANNPLATNSIELQAAGDCFVRLSVETSVMPEFSKIVLAELEACRSFSACPVMTIKGKDFSTKIKRVSSIYAKDEKLMLSVRNAICK